MLSTYGELLKQIVDLFLSQGYDLSLPQAVVVFGNLKPNGLSPCQKKRYQNHFCGACRSMAKGGRLWSLATSFDIAFLYLVAAALEDAPIGKNPCTALPFNKVETRELSPEISDWIRATNVLLIEAKLRDDCQDGPSRIAGLSLKLLSRRARDSERVLESLGLGNEHLAQLPARQAEIEVKEGLYLEHYSHNFALCLGQIFAQLAELLQRPELRASLVHLGQSLGTLIYLKDAWDDRKEDARKKRFNALSASGECLSAVSSIAEREMIRAKWALRALELGSDGSVAEELLADLLPDLSPEMPVRKPRKSQAGICEAFLCCCDLGACFSADVCVNACVCCPWDACCLCCGEKTQGRSVVVPTKVEIPKPTLLCPACGEKMSLHTYSAIEVDECPRCRGLWLDKGELEQLGSLPSLPERLTSAHDYTIPRLRPEGTRPCPRCGDYLITSLVNETKIDLCQECQGIWLDQGELNQLLEKPTNDSPR